MTTLLRSLALVSGLLLLAACSDDREPGDHVWKEQTEALERAEDVNRLIMEADDERRRILDEQSE